MFTCDTPTYAYSRRAVPFGVRTQHFDIFTLKTPFLDTYNGKPIANTYSHNCMMQSFDAEIWQAV